MNDRNLTQSDYAALADFRYQIRRYLRFSEQAARQGGVEPQQHQLLLALKGSGKSGMRIADLAERLQIQHHSAVELVDRLEEHALIQRGRGTDDRREVYVSLTARGDQILRELTLHHREELRSAAPALIAFLRRVASGKRTSTQTRSPKHPRPTAKEKA
jgi:DNA-binding MarR family transcriptional regulator